MSTAGNADGTVDVRAEDAFDAAAVHDWLSGRVPGLGDRPPVVRQFPGGASNLTYLLAYPGRELILRRPPAGRKAVSAHDMRREYRVQRAVKPVFPYVPEMLAFGTGEDGPLGGDFYVMERLGGLILRGDLPAGLDLTPRQARELSGRVVDRLVQLHSVDVDAAGLADLGKGAGYVERQVRGWTGRFEKARTDDVGDFAEVIGWLAENQPGEARICLVHNDYRLDNLVLDGPETLQVTGVLDWELATLGDPLMELGSTLSYWVQADDDDVMKASRRQPTHLPGMYTREEFVAHYAEAAGLEVGDWRFYEVYGLFRLAVVIQQLYRRYRDGDTHNPAFKDFGPFVRYLEGRCREVIRKGRA